VQSHKVLGIGAIFALIGVAAGAFGAHGLRDHLTSDQMGIYQTGVYYQLFHSLTLVVLGAQSRIRASAAAWLFVVGIVIFSGSLYGLAISGVKWLGAITPLGGVSFLAAWALVTWDAFKSQGRASTE
jgi:uncharacterized membrane protein YgdD (TMEM256/DUF423 family)